MHLRKALQIPTVTVSSSVGAAENCNSESVRGGHFRFRLTESQEHILVAQSELKAAQPLAWAQWSERNDWLNGEMRVLETGARLKPQRNYAAI